MVLLTDFDVYLDDTVQGGRDLGRGFIDTPTISAMKRKSYNIQNHLHYITFSCYRRQALLNDAHIRSALLQHWRDAVDIQKFSMTAYVVMPNHVHLLIKPSQQDYDTKNILRHLKEPFSRWLVKYYRANDPTQLNRVTTIIGGKRMQRVWQRGGGYDRNLYSRDTVNRAIEYIEFNPVNAGYVHAPENWRWSSAFARKNSRDILLPVIPVEDVGI